MSDETEYTLYFEETTLAAFRDLVQEHCEHLLQEFYNEDANSAALTQDDERRRATLCLMAASAIQLVVRDVLMDMTGMPASIAKYVYEQTESFARKLTEDMGFLEDFEKADVDFRTMPGGDA